MTAVSKVSCVGESLLISCFVCLFLVLGFELGVFGFNYNYKPLCLLPVPVATASRIGLKCRPHIILGPCASFEEWERTAGRRHVKIFVVSASIGSIYDLGVDN